MILETSLVTQLPSDGWFEGFAGLTDGHILVTRIDQPELYKLDAEDPDAEPQLLYTFSSTDASGLVHLCPIPGHDNDFLVLSGNVDLISVKAENYIVWRVTLGTNSDPPTVTQVAHLPDAGLALGLVAVSQHMLLVCDSAKHCIYRVHLQTGKCSVLVTDQSFQAASAEDFFGINRVCVVGSYLWFTNSSRGILGRVPVELDEAVEDCIQTTGAVEILTDDLPHCDGLAVTPDEKTAYTACMTDGRLWRVDIGSDRQASTSVVMENLVNPTAVEFVHTHGISKLYVVCSGEIQLGWRNSDNSSASWSEFADINNSVTVTVTTVVENVKPA
ncbi:uncharacterized protein BCR38DRAFT_416735 [Pseudomassariella vexata]|uniref:Six-bladed beta-propeller-like protein n=1 Tax=Pseudomassariella vexata TaxID=1141098 RepID=A0A1Y2EKP6_9PEZI|nr:uncharacterized protein BCR38DRAFT_416735 [Pseudomassariella vexata]ORY71415.1 hypothetical protein BCR38DRAFT_416735 [Pseudomassariella vexata]